MIKLIVQITKLIVSLLLVLLLFSCVNNGFNTINGNGNVVTTKRNVANFSNIKAQNGLTVILEQGNSTLIEVEADENLQDHILVKVEDETLTVFTDANIFKYEMKEVRIKAPHFIEIDASSGASLHSKNTITEPTLDIESSSGSTISIEAVTTNISCDSSSGSNITVTGKAQNVTTESSSGSSIHLSNLEALHAKSESSSGSSTSVYASESFIGDASSGSSIVCYGNPKQVTKDESSGGSVTTK